MASVLETPPLPVPAPRYERKGRRDPFEVVAVREGSDRTTVSAAKLAGIVRSSKETLALVETADGLGYILRRGDTLGEGRLLEIGGDNVVFTIPPRPGSTTTRVVLRLAAD